MTQTVKNQNRKIFNDIVKLMENDYAGARDITVDAQPFFQQLENLSGPKAFQYMVEDYLRCFHDGHVTLSSKKTTTLGFSCRRFANSLFVTQVTAEKRLQPGDQIVAVDGETIPKLGERYADQLDAYLDRQMWGFLLARAQQLTVRTATGEKAITLKHYPYTYRAQHEWRLLNENTGYLKLTDFANPDVLTNLFTKNQTTFDRLEYLIVDMRINYGGNDATYTPLLAYFADQPTDIVAKLPANFNYEFWWTIRNKKNWLTALKTLQEANPTPAMHHLYQEQSDFWQSALTLKQASQRQGSDKMVIQPRGHLRHVYILSDYLAGSAGDNFVRLAKTFSKVTVVGRNTMGIVDYGDVAEQVYPNFSVAYPVSRLAMLDEAEGTNGIGIAPDVRLPWTPKAIFQDSDLAYVLNLIS
ncbi:S41 family peptidase [Pediococcus siamensis]|uniref:S41 family peptidase n=1 Tax=Pediococcus siamensis TaxID=381829 RepID=UPI00399FD419